jgi:hypothetical protein
MAYQINKWDGTPLVVLEDGRIDTSTSLKLVGRNYVGYGEIQNENFIHLLENFSGDGPPSTPIEGQLWFDSDKNILNVYDGADWGPVSSASVTDEAPTTPAIGDFWFKNTTKQLFVYDGTSPYSATGWKIIGPEAVDLPFGTTRLVSRRITDASGNFHAISQLVADNAVLAIISNDIFTIGTVDAIPGFSQITKGITMASTADIQGSLDGTAAAALKLFTPKRINGVNFDGTQDIRVPASLDFSLSRGTHIIGGNVSFNGTEDITWSVDASSNNVNGKLVLRDSIGNFAAGEITASFKGNLTGNVTGDVFSDNGVRVLDAGTTGNNATFIGDVTGNISGNAQTTSRFLVPRTINGVSFNGTENITITANVNAGLFAGQYIVANKSGGLQTDPYTGQFSETWNIRADTTSQPLHLVARDNQGNFEANQITAVAFKGNADTATRLLFNRNINNIPFNGTSDIRIFDDSKLPTTGGQMTGFLTLHSVPTQPFHAATKGYVDAEALRVERLIPLLNPMFFSLDTRGLNERAQGGPGSVVELLNVLAPTATLKPFVTCRIVSTIQNVSSTIDSATARYIGIRYVTSSTVTTTVANPTRNNDLLYQVNSNSTSWEYVSG